MRRRICVFTGTRAEYSLLRLLMEKIKKDKDLSLQIIASGMHLSPEFGLTYKEIEKDGFSISEKVDILLDSDTAVGVCKSIGLGMASFSKAYERLDPDIVVILGDRFEAFAAATAAMITRIPIAHIHGGEATFGAIDEAIRHSITKMSHLHFTSTEAYRNKVIRLGENPKNVFNVGTLGIDNIERLSFLSKKKLEKDLNIRFKKRNFLVTYHPVTLEKGTSRLYFGNLLDVLSGLKDTYVIFTKANADMEGRVINRMIDSYVSTNTGKAVAFTSLGRLRYLSCMRLVDACVGNSSSGIIEAPSFKIGTINIGDRQEGRIKTKSVIDCGPSKRGIREAIERLYSGQFQESLKSVVNPYGNGHAAKRIHRILREYDLSDILKKEFYEGFISSI